MTDAELNPHSWIPKHAQNTPLEAVWPKLMEIVLHGDVDKVRAAVKDLGKTKISDLSPSGKKKLAAWITDCKI